ncbi:Protein ccc1 [Clarireedia jacksonii]
MHLVEQPCLETGQVLYYASCPHDTQFQPKYMSETLLQSPAGVNLPAEVCLRVIELVVGSDTKDAVTLMRLSRSFRKLILTYEHSLTKHVAGEYRKASVNQGAPIIVVSAPRTRHKSFRPAYFSHTFGWLQEVEMRARIAREVIQDEFSQCLRPTSEFFDVPSLPTRCSLIELELRSTKFKEEAIKLLYELVDASKGIEDERIIRGKQIEFMRQLTTTELAVICIFVALLGFNYCEKLTRRPSQAGPNIKELACVFEDRVLRHGPIYAWLQISALTKCNRVTLRGTMVWNEWFEEQQEMGLLKLAAFEAGQQHDASLTCIIWRIFHERKEIQDGLQAFSPPHPHDVYNIALEFVGMRMAQYELL